MAPDAEVLMQLLEAVYEKLEAQHLIIQEHDARLKAQKSEHLKELTIMYERQLQLSEKVSKLAAEVAELGHKRPIVALDVNIEDPSSKSYSISRPALRRWRWDPLKRRRVEEKRASDTGHEGKWVTVEEQGPPNN